MVNRFLKEHCLIAWEGAVYNCKLILDGLVDVIQQKLFISSFQNAIELCFKQIMLDECFYNVVDYGKMSPELACQYLSSTDLNTFLFSLPKEKVSGLFSIEFNKMIDFIASKMTNDVKEGLSLLKNLRNNETHFYIDVNDYMSFVQFEKLCKLLNDIGVFLKNKNIITLSEPKNLFGSSTSTVSMISDFTITDYDFKSYDHFINTSKTNQDILNNFGEPTKDETDGFMYSYRDDDYGIAYEIYSNKNDMGCDFIIDMNFYEFYRRFKLLKNKHLRVYSDYEEYEEVIIGEDAYGYPEEQVVINAEPYNIISRKK